MHKIVLGLGSNKSFSDKSCVDILLQACVHLNDFVKEMCFSSIYKTQAMYVTDQDDFYNMVVLGFYEGNPQELLKQINKVEAILGRDRTKEIRFGQRSLDIDIELFDDLTIHEENLIIPHERLEERAFVLKPLLDIWSKNADEESKVLYYSNKLDQLKNQKIELFMTETEFKKEFEKLVR